MKAFKADVEYRSKATAAIAALTDAVRILEKKASQVAATMADFIVDAEAIAFIEDEAQDIFAKKGPPWDPFNRSKYWISMHRYGPACGTDAALLAQKAIRAGQAATIAANAAVTLARNILDLDLTSTITYKKRHFFLPGVGYDVASHGVVLASHSLKGPLPPQMRFFEEADPCERIRPCLQRLEAHYQCASTRMELLYDRICYTTSAQDTGDASAKRMAQLMDALQDAGACVEEAYKSVAHAESFRRLVGLHIVKLYALYYEKYMVDKKVVKKDKRAKQWRWCVDLDKAKKAERAAALAVQEARASFASAYQCTGHKEHLPPGSNDTSFVASS